MEENNQEYVIRRRKQTTIYVYQVKLSKKINLLLKSMFDFGQLEPCNVNHYKPL